MEDILASQDKGNFASGRDRASEAGRKGGEASHGGQSSQSSAKSGQQTGGNFTNDLASASESGRKGGERSGGNRS
jgi:general stress protein YciG